MKYWLIVLAACGSAAPPPSAPPPQPHHQHHQHEHHQHAGKQPLGHRFESADKFVPIFDDPKRDDWQKPDRVIADLEISPGMVVADIGAGTGYFEKRLSVAVGPSGRVIAVDIEIDMARYLRERAVRERTTNVEVHPAVPGNPMLASQSVDRILIVNTWHHIPDRVAYAKKLAEALKRAGFVLIVDFTMETSKGPPRAHRIDAATVMSELKQGGLDATLIESGLPDQFVVKALELPPTDRVQPPRGKQ